MGKTTLNKYLEELAGKFEDSERALNFLDSLYNTMRSEAGTIGLRIPDDIKKEHLSYIVGISRLNQNPIRALGVCERVYYDAIINEKSPLYRQERRRKNALIHKDVLLTCLEEEQEVTRQLDEEENSKPVPEGLRTRLESRLLRGGSTIPGISEKVSDEEARRYGIYYKKSLR